MVRIDELGEIAIDRIEAERQACIGLREAPAKQVGSQRVHRIREQRLQAPVNA